MDTILLNLILFLLLPIILLYRSRLHITVLDDSVITIDDSNAIRGIAAVFVMIAHYLLEIQENSNIEIGPARLFSWFGGLGVCLFFFLSGYGMQIRYSDKKLDISFLVKRFIRIYPSYIILRILFGWIQIIENGLGIEKGLLYILGIYDPMWFIVEILIIYSLYFIASCLFHKHLIVCMILMLLTLSGMFYINNFEAHWYNSNLLFAIGLICAKYWHKITTFLIKAFIYKIIFVAALFSISAVIFALYKNSLFSNCFKIFAGTMFCILFVQINMIIHWNSKVLFFIGTSSLELYIIHQNIWRIYCRYVLVDGFSLKFTICSVCSVCFALLYKYFYSKWIYHTTDREKLK